MPTTIEDIEKASAHEEAARNRFVAIGMTNVAGRSEVERRKINTSYHIAEAELMRAQNVRRELQDRYARGV